MSAPQDPIAWLRACARDKNSPAELLRDSSQLGQLTGQDIQTLRAIGHCWNLYASGDAAAREASLLAVRNLVATMQAKCRPVARELIAYALDWSDRDELWAAVACQPCLYVDAVRKLTDDLVFQIQRASITWALLRAAKILDEKGHPKASLLVAELDEHDLCREMNEDIANQRAGQQ